MDATELVRLQQKGFVCLNRGWLDWCLSLMLQEPVIHSAATFLLSQTKKGGGELRYDSGSDDSEDDEEEEGGEEEQEQKKKKKKPPSRVPGQGDIIPYWMDWVTTCHRYACAVGFVASRTLKSIRDARARKRQTDNSDSDEEQYRYRGKRRILQPRTKRKKRKSQKRNDDDDGEGVVGSDEDSDEERDKLDMEWFADDDEDLIPMVLDLQRCIVFFKKDVNQLYQFRVFEERDQFTAKGGELTGMPMKQSLKYYEIRDVVWKVLEGPDMDGCINSKVRRCHDMIFDEQLMKHCYRSATQFLARPLMALEEQQQTYKGENTAGFDAFSKGINTMGNGQAPGPPFLSAGQVVVTNHQAQLDDQKRKHAEELAQLQSPVEEGQVLLPSGRKLVQHKEPQTPPEMLELLAQRKQRCWEIFNIPPGIQQQLNPFEGKAAAQESGGTGSGGGGGGGQRSLGGMTPTAEAWNITLNNERRWLMDYGNEIINRATAPHRVRRAAMCQRDPQSKRKTHDPDKHKIKFVINAVPSLAKLEELYDTGEVEREFMLQAWSTELTIPLSRFTEEGEEEGEGGEGGDKSKKKPKKKKQKSDG
jgi:hypothetical protein